MPSLTEAQVTEFVGLGKFGREQLILDGPELAEPAFRKQIEIFPGNYEPFVSLAFLESRRGNRKAALAHLRSAVLRGFTDLNRVQRAEGWTVKPRTPGILELIDAVPRLVKLERDWPPWDAFHATQALPSLAVVEKQSIAVGGHIKMMAPALGPRLTRLWTRIGHRATAAQIEAYVVRNADAPDLERSLERLMSLYAGEALQRWEKRPEEVARRLGSTASLLLDRFPHSPRVPEALVASALAAYSVRDPEGELSAESLESIRRSLGDVLEEHRGADVVASAIVGLLRTELAAGNPQRAVADYKKFKNIHAADTRLCSRVQSELGTTGLRLAGLPEFQATTLDGGTIDPASLAGKVVVLDFWATWCGPCLDGFPTLQKIDAKYGPDVTPVSVNLDYSDAMPPETLREWIASQKLPGSHIGDGQSWESNLVQAFGVKEIPFNVVVDSQGAVVALNKHGKKLERAVHGAVTRKSTDRNR